MEKKSNFTAILIMLHLVMFSNDFGLTLSTAIAETDVQFISKVAGTDLDTAISNHVNLPATVVFTANEPVKIYYTTNGTLPTTSDPYVKITSAKGTAIGPTLTSTDYMFLAQGVDSTGSLTPLMIYTLVTP